MPSFLLFFHSDCPWLIDALRQRARARHAALYTPHAKQVKLDFGLFRFSLQRPHRVA